jgi:hypothetical protein
MSEPTRNDSDLKLARINATFEHVEQDLEELYETVATGFGTWRRKVGETEYGRMLVLVENWGNKNIWSPSLRATESDEIVTLVFATRRFLHPNAVPELALQELFATNNAEEFLKRLIE